jgi:hypothetical protein
MSTNVVRPTTTSGTGHPSRFLGVATAVLAVVTALGVVFAVNQRNDVTVVAPAHPVVSDAHRAKAEILAERAAAAAVSPGANIEAYRLEQAAASGVTQSPGANIEQYKLDMGVIGVEPTSTFNIEQYRFEIERAERARAAWSDRLQGLAESAQRSPLERIAE